MAASVSLRSNPLQPLLSRCMDSCPLVTRLVVTLYLLTLLPALLPLSWLNDALVDSAALCVAPLHASDSPLSLLHRFFLSPLVHTELASGLASCFAIWVIGTRIEQQRGSMALAQLLLTLLVLTQCAHAFLVTTLLVQPEMVQQARDSYYLRLDASSPSERLRMPVWGEQTTSSLPRHSTWSSYSIPTQACSVGNYAIVFALVALECCAFTKDRQRFLFLFPYPLPTRVMPLVLFAAHQLFFGMQLHALIGLLVGYAAAWLPFLILPAGVLRLLECGWLVRHESFVSVKEAGLMQPWSHYRHVETEPLVGPPQPAGAASTGSGGAAAAGAASAASPRVASPHIARSSVAVSRAARNDAVGGWRRAGSGSGSSSVAALDSSSSSDALSSSSSDADDDLPPGPGSINAPYATGAPRSSASATALAANVAKIIDVSVYPTRAPSEGEIQRVRAVDEALQQQT